MTKLEMTEAHYTALGRMLVAFQELDFTVTNQLRHLMYPHPADFIQSLTFPMTVLTELPFSRRVDLISNFIENLPDADKPREEWRHEEFSVLISDAKSSIRQIRKVEEDRNRLVHSNWIGGGMCGVDGLPSGTAMRSKRSARDKAHKPGWEFMQAKDILEIVERIEAAETSIYRCTKELGLHIAYTKSTRKDQP